MSRGISPTNVILYSKILLTISAMEQPKIKHFKVLTVDTGKRPIATNKSHLVFLEPNDSKVRHVYDILA